MNLEDAVKKIKNEEEQYLGLVQSEKLAGNIVKEANCRGTATGLQIALRILAEVKP